METQKKPIGEVLVDIGVMTKEQVHKILSMQKQGDTRRFGQIAIEMGYIDDEALMKYVNLQKDTTGQTKSPSPP